MPYYECCECGAVKEEKKKDVWPRCGRHKMVGMVRVLNWGRGGGPEKISEKEVSKNKGNNGIQNLNFVFKAGVI